MTNDFLPAGYAAPTSSGYMKFQNGENRFRILDKPIVGWLDWENKKPLRFAYDNKPAPIDPTKPVKHFWAFVVWNVKEAKVQVLEITQKSIQNAITNLSQDSDWGSPFGYDIKVTKSGSGMDTEYTVNPAPKSPISEEVKNEFKATKINLQALFSGGNPFDSAPTKESPKATKKASNDESFTDLPF